jgi:hypothetical protein
MNTPREHRGIEVIDRDYATILRMLTPAQRLEAMFAANEHVRHLMAAGTKMRHPDWSAEQIQKHVAECWLHDTR